MAQREISEISLSFELGLEIMALVDNTLRKVGTNQGVFRSSEYKKLYEDVQTHSDQIAGRIIEFARAVVPPGSE